MTKVKANSYSALSDAEHYLSSQPSHSCSVLLLTHEVVLDADTGCLLVPFLDFGGYPESESGCCHSEAELRCEPWLRRLGHSDNVLGRQNGQRSLYRKAVHENFEHQCLAVPSPSSLVVLLACYRISHNLPPSPKNRVRI